jgi:uncharacterized membrane protein required for colicin V production
VVFVIVFLAIEYVGTTIIRLAQLIHFNWIDRLAGALLGASIGGIVAGFVVLTLSAILPPDADLLRNSRLAPKVLGYNQVLMAYVPAQVKESFEQKRGKLYRQWVKHEDPEPSPSPAK